MDKYLSVLMMQSDLFCQNSTPGQGVEICHSQRDAKWFKARAPRLTSSNFGKVYKRVSFENMEKFVNGFFTNFDSSKVPALHWGTTNEPKAFSRYQQSLSKG